MPHGLEPLLGPDGCRRLAAVLRERTLAVARAHAGERVVLGGEPRGRALAVSTDVPRLTVAHLRVAEADLDAGADLSLGSSLDGAAYLVAMRHVDPEVLAHAPGGDPDPDALARALGAARKAGLEVGLLRMERRLRTPADAAAMLADPLLPAEVRDALCPGGDA